MTSNLSPAPTAPSPMVPAMQLALDANFGSAALWLTDIERMADSLAATGGQVDLIFQPEHGSLINQASPTQALASPSSGSLLTLQMHANRPFNAEAWAQQIDWATAYALYQHAVHAATESLGASPDDLAGALLIDVRRAGVYAQARQMLPGAQWRDPALVAQWASELPHDRPVRVYCIYGHEVGRATALRLHAAGVQARYLQGGIDGWTTAGRPLQDIEGLPQRPG